MNTTLVEMRLVKYDSHIHSRCLCRIRRYASNQRAIQKSRWNIFVVENAYNKDEY